jgi:hypothetical protein
MAEGRGHAPEAKNGSTPGTQVRTLGLSLTVLRMRTEQSTAPCPLPSPLGRAPSMRGPFGANCGRLETT